MTGSARAGARGKARPALRPAPRPFWPRPVPGCPESPELRPLCAAGTLAPPASPGPRRRYAVPRGQSPRSGDPKRRGGAEGRRAGAPGALDRSCGRGAAARAGGRHAAGQRPGCGSVAELAPLCVASAPLPGSAEVVPGTGWARSGAASPTARVPTSVRPRP